MATSSTMFFPLFLLVSLGYTSLTPIEKPTAKAVQVVSVTDGQFELNKDALSSMLMSDKCKDRKVAVVSIAGPFRKGKSFLLNYILKYLTRRQWQSNDDEWLSSGPQNEPLEGFDWSGRVDTVTIGIQMWSEAFVIPFGNEEVCVLLMDTQGLHDSEHTIKNTALIFALSTLTSSVQIFNVKESIQEDAIQSLDMFSAYGKLMSDEDPDHAPFQKLLFLVRDWPYPDEFPYGLDGGKRYLEKRFYVDHKTPSDVRKARENIKSYYESVSCFLMPHPGQGITRPNFRGELKNMDYRFVSQLESFIQQLMSPIILKPKSVGGSTVTGAQLLEYFQSYFDVFKNGSLPEPKTMLDATAEGVNKATLVKAKDHYLSKMTEYLKTSPSDEELEAFHVETSKETVKVFDKVPKIGDEVITVRCRQELIDFLKSTYDQFRTNNSDKLKILAELDNIKAKSIAFRAYNEFMDKVLEERTIDEPFIEEDKLFFMEKKARGDSLYLFDRIDTRGDIDLKESSKSELMKNINRKWQTIKTNNYKMETYSKNLNEQSRLMIDEELFRQRQATQEEISALKKEADQAEDRIKQLQVSSNQKQKCLTISFMGFSLQYCW